MEKEMSYCLPVDPIDWPEPWLDRYIRMVDLMVEKGKVDLVLARVRAQAQVRRAYVRRHG